MIHSSDAAKAEQLSKKRARMMPILAVLLLGQQATYFSDTGLADRTVDHVHVAAWLVLSIVILLVLVTGGGWIYSRDVRRLANDEATRAHRGSAFSAGFLSSMSACVVIYFVSLFQPVGGREAVHLVMTVGIGVTLICFGVLERRAHRGD
jgi:hypothetical protein